ncbi:MAG: methionyl-tRNA formyltransferase [bacterium]|nr:methionyl-tRNA formyltransferase [bacterium]
MKVAFFGTPEFALPALKAFRHNRHQVVGVVTAPDKPRGRGREVLPTPVAEYALKAGFPLLKPDRLKDPLFQSNLRAWDAEIFVVVAFRILPPEVFTLPVRGSVNLHASLLPAYRGAAPIQWALWKGERETGVTTFLIERNVDVGNILKQRAVEVLDDDDAGSLGIRLAETGAELIVATLDELEANSLVSYQQDNSKASAAPKILPEHCLIDWHQPALQIGNQIRALSPEPTAYTYLNDQQIKIFRSDVVTSENYAPAGTIIIDDRAMLVSTGQDKLRITVLQQQGKKKLSVEDFLRGFRSRGTFQLRSIKG